MVKVDKKLISYSNCINCNKKFNVNEIETAREIDQGEDSAVLHITCKKCQTSMLLGLVSGKAMGIIGVATDLTVKDLLDKYGNKEITTDEIIKLSDIINKIQ